MGQGQPVTQETTTRQTVYAGLPTDALSMPGAPKKSQPCIAYMAQIAQDANCAGYQIEVSRTLPAVYNGQRFPFGILERFPPAPYLDIYEQMRQIHGGGSYKIRVLSEEGQQVHAMVFSIDTLQCPPILRVPNQGYGAVGAAPGNTNAGSFAAIGGAADDIMNLRQEEQRYRTEEQVLISKNRVEQTARNIEKQRRREAEEEERRFQGPQNEAAQRIIGDLRHETDSRFQAMNSSFDKLLLLLSQQKPADNGMAAMMPMMVELIKSSSQTTAAIMTAIISGGGNKSTEMANILKMQSDSQEKLFTVMLNNSTQSSAKSEKLIEQVFLHRLNQPEDSLKQALDMQDRGRKDTMEMWRLIEEARGDREGGDVIDPEGGFFGNMGNLILHGLKSLVSGAARGGGKQAMELLSGILQKPAGTTQFTEQELQQAAQQIEQTRRQQRPALAALPAPMQQQPQTINIPAAPPPGQVIKSKPKLFDRVYEIVGEQQAAPAVIIPSPPSAQAPMPAPAIPVVEVQMQQQQGVMVETEEVKQAQGAVVETSGDDYINEAISMAVADLKVGRREHDWVEFALGKWTRDFLQQIAQARDDAERIKLLQASADPGLFQELVELLMDAQKPQQYRDFIENLTALREGAQEGALSAAA